MYANCSLLEKLLKYYIQQKEFIVVIFMISISVEKTKKYCSSENTSATEMALFFQRLYLASSSAFNFKLSSWLNIFIRQIF